MTRASEFSPPARKHVKTGRAAHSQRTATVYHFFARTCSPTNRRLGESRHSVERANLIWHVSITGCAKRDPVTSLTGFQARDGGRLRSGRLSTRGGDDMLPEEFANHGALGARLVPIEGQKRPPLPKGTNQGERRPLP